MMASWPGSIPSAGRTVSSSAASRVASELTVAPKLNAGSARKTAALPGPVAEPLTMRTDRNGRARCQAPRLAARLGVVPEKVGPTTRSTSRHPGSLRRARWAASSASPSSRPRSSSARRSAAACTPAVGTSPTR